MLENLLQISISIINFLQTQLAWLSPVMKFFTFLGNEEFYLLIMPLLVWSVDYKLGLRLGVMLMLSGSLNFFLKLGFHQPRPYWVSSKIKDLTTPMGSFGLPSGHSQNAASVFGLMATSTKQKWLRGLIIFTIIMVAFSRLYLGVHSITDILLGLLVGVFILWIFLKFEERTTEYFQRQKIIVRIMFVFGISIALTFLGILFVDVFQGIPLPNEWIQNANIAHPEKDISPFAIDGLVTTTAALFGLLAGGIWVEEKGGYRANTGPFLKHILRFIIGLAGILLIWKGLGSVFPRTGDLLSFSLRYLRYALIGVWITGIAPLVFIRTKLGEKEI
jgi:membrane-associated phospholipid phosphatase